MSIALLRQRMLRHKAYEYLLQGRGQIDFIDEKSAILTVKIIRCPAKWAILAATVKQCWTLQELIRI